MKLLIYRTKKEMGQAAATKAAEILKDAIERRGKAVFVAATGASQFDFLDALTKIEIDWSKTVMFHLDEYIGLPEAHPASFRQYLRERLVNKVRPRMVHFIRGDAPDPEKECRRLNEIISGEEIDVAFVGIGENGHLAFNDPPANFEVEHPYIVVDLAESCRKQQVSEGWFSKLDDVPKKAITMSINQILKARNIICVVPEKRKARAVKETLEGDITPNCPASILRTHKGVWLFLDKDSASLLCDDTIKKYSVEVPNG